jgi:hypothetical protein
VRAFVAVAVFVVMVVVMLVVVVVLLLLLPALRHNSGMTLLVSSSFGCAAALYSGSALNKSRTAVGGLSQWLSHPSSCPVRIHHSP